MDTRKVARALGWFSIGLGLAELAMPKQLCEWLGIENQEKLLRMFGVREVAAGVMILAQSDRSRGLWSRVAGDGLDLAALGVATTKSYRQNAVIAAIASVAAITALDILAATKMTRDGADSEIDLAA